MILLKCKVCYFYSALFFVFLFFRWVQLITSLGRKKTESNCLANFPRTISQTSSLFRQSQEKRERGEKGREPLPSFPNPPTFSLPPYPLPLPTPPTQATCRTPDCRIYYVNIHFLSLRRRRSSARNVPSGEERVRKLLRHCGGKTRQVIWELIFVQEELCGGSESWSWSSVKIECRSSKIYANWCRRILQCRIEYRILKYEHVLKQTFKGVKN